MHKSSVHTYMYTHTHTHMQMSRGSQRIGHDRVTRHSTRIYIHSIEHYSAIKRKEPQMWDHRDESEMQALSERSRTEKDNIFCDSSRMNFQKRQDYSLVMGSVVARCWEQNRGINIRDIRKIFEVIEMFYIQILVNTTTTYIGKLTKLLLKFVNFIF